VDKKILQKYFRNQCTLEEIEQVMNWFQTEEGKDYVEQRLDRDMQRYAEEENLLLHPEVPSDEILENIKRKKKRKIIHPKRREYWEIKIAVVLLICVALAGSSYWLLKGTGYEEEQEPETVYRTISTLEDQQRLVTLSDGTQIRLNANSSIVIPEHFPPEKRKVTLKGEAFFNVASDVDRPFSIQVEGAVIWVLGTEFNVKVKEFSRQVQVAVSEGRVSLSGEADVEGRSAILTANTFAQYHLDSGEILIERTPVDNYLSWISGNLYFYDEPLWVVSRYLERLFGVSFRFRNEQLKELTLSTNIIKRDLLTVLDIISQTLGIDYGFENDTVMWMDSR
jgi:transmembrane sensor